MSHTNTPSKTDRVCLLADPTRRRICSILTDPDPPVSERDLAVELATRCLDTSPSEITDTQRRKYLLRIYHHQLPKLADYGLITYDRSTSMVAITTSGRNALQTVRGTPQESPIVLPTDA